MPAAAAQAAHRVRGHGRRAQRVDRDVRPAAGELPDRGGQTIGAGASRRPRPRPLRRRAARASAAAETSTASTRTPRAAPIITADSPTPPQPCTASQSPATRPCAVTARNAVANRQPRQAAVTKSTSAGSATRLASAACTATSSANEPGPVNPGWVCRGHTWASPARQCSQPAAAAGERHRHPVPGAPPGHPGPGRDDHPGELVPADVRQRHRIVALPGVPVRPAYAGRAHRDDHPVGRAVRIGDLRQHRGGPVPGVDHRLHEALAPNEAEPSPSKASPSVVVW